MSKQKVLIAGASGLIGYAAVRHFSGLADWDVVAVSRRAPATAGRASFISVDLLDAKRSREVFQPMSDVTHVVYAAVNEKPGLIEGWLEREQMERNLSMLRNLFEPLEAAAKNLRHVSLLQGTVRSPSRSDRDSCSRAVTTPPSGEFLLVAGGLSPGEATR